MLINGNHKSHIIFAAFAIVFIGFLFLNVLPVHAADYTASGKCGTCDWYIDEDGVLTITEGELEDWSEEFWDYPPWYEYAEDYVQSVVTVGTVKLATCKNLFNHCSNLKSLDMSGFDASDVADMSSMFYSCDCLERINLGEINTSGVTNMQSMFSFCSSLESLDLSNFNTSNVTAMQDMFSNCSSLKSLNLSNFDTSNVIDMNCMFHSCYSLKSLDLRNFDTSNVAYMYSMFMQCSSLESLDLSGFDTSNITDMSSMFQNCYSLESVKLNNFDTSKVTTMHDMFNCCESLYSLDLSSFYTPSVTDMWGMFSGCESLEHLDICNFNTTSVEEMRYMFSGCERLASLDLSSFNTSGIEDMWHMFEGCESLSTLKVGKWDISSIMFSLYATFPVAMLDKNDSDKKYKAGDTIPTVSYHTFVRESPMEETDVTLTKEDLFKGYTSYLNNHAYSEMLSTLYDDEYEVIWGSGATLTVGAIKKVLAGGGAGSIRILLESAGVQWDSDKMREEVARDCLSAVQKENTPRMDLMEGLKADYDYLKLMKSTSTNYLSLAKEIAEGSGDKYTFIVSYDMLNAANKSSKAFKIADQTFNVLQATLTCMATMQARKEIIDVLDEYAPENSDLHKGLWIIERKLNKRTSTNIVETMFKEGVFDHVTSEAASLIISLPTAILNGSSAGPLTFFVEAGYKSLGKMIPGADSDDINRAAMAYSNAINLEGCRHSKKMECTDNHQNNQGRSVKKLMGQYAILYAGQLESIKQSYDYCQEITTSYSQDAKAVLDYDFAKYGPLLTYDKYIESCLRSANIDYRYKLLENGDVRILGIRNEDVVFVDGDNIINIPKKVDGHNVAEIGANAFAGNNKIKCLSVPATVKKVGDNAFSGCSTLSSVFVEGPVKEIGSRAFADCDELSLVEIPESVETISEDAFEGSDNVVISASDGSVGEEFAEDNNLELKISEPTVTGINIASEPTKKQYLITEDLDESGLVVMATYADGSTADVTEEAICTLSDRQIGTNTVTVRYDTCETSFDITMRSAECEYTVCCVDEDGNNLITETTETATYGDKVIVKAPAVEGHTAFEPQQTLTVGLDSEVVFIYMDGVKKNIREAQITLGTIPEANGQQIKPAVTVKYGEEMLTAGVDYELIYGDNVEVGSKSGLVAINGIGNYMGIAVTEFDIIKHDQNHVQNHIHTWKHIKNPAGLLKNGKEYDKCTVCGAQQNMKVLVGYATYYVKSFKVVKGKKAFTAKWKKQSKKNLKKFNGYQIRYSTKSNMKGAKYKTAGKKATYKKIGKLKAKTKYYVQVRTYTKTKSGTFYSKWSGKKSVKTR